MQVSLSERDGRRIPTIDGHTPFPVGAAAENIDSLACVRRHRARLLVDILRFVSITFERPVSDDGDARAGLIPVGSI